MHSLFSIFGRRENEPVIQPASEAMPASFAMAMASSAPEISQIIPEMLDLLKDVLLAAPNPIAASLNLNVSASSINEKPLAIGNDRGLELRGPLGPVALKGGRLDAVVRFQVMHNNPNLVEDAIQTIQNKILSDKENLQSNGFLKIKVKETSLAEFLSQPDMWRKTTDFQVLFEYHYQDTDGAESIIARIPIHSDPEIKNSPNRETTVVTDKIVRWDDEFANALEFSGTSSTVKVMGLANLAYLPAAWNGSQVTLAIHDLNSANPPTSFPTLTDFLDAVTAENNPNHHALVTFNTMTDFIAEFTVIGDPINLGEWDVTNAPNPFQAGTLIFNPPILLTGNNELFQLVYQDSVFDSKAVVYLKASTNKR